MGEVNASSNLRTRYIGSIHNGKKPLMQLCLLRVHGETGRALWRFSECYRNLLQNAEDDLLVSFIVMHLFRWLCIQGSCKRYAKWEEGHT